MQYLIKRQHNNKNKGNIGKNLNSVQKKKQSQRQQPPPQTKDTK